jgi:hypothetical protein
MISREEAEKIVNNFYSGQHYPRLTMGMEEQLVELAEAYSLGKLIDYKYLLGVQNNKINYKRRKQNENRNNQRKNT